MSSAAIKISWVSERQVEDKYRSIDVLAVADPGFPVGGRAPVRGAWTSDAGAFQ